ncbi:beta-galactosidase [Kribbella orskensis]|uniref:Beta-galactosidase n=1 Tax=Kribbella orskensis TaxID=2512216 RepID=A0ABY2BUL1_9ACTN|nr:MULTISPECIES: beta-galactosidase [Kribbella]TCN44540.1 beta-galactosidase [Kribbella sp. VKM Ac-2500]TCO31682.1 beta-galactosidase [Kribbella orskensis]
MAELYFGGDYNPEQWSPAVWAEDMALMRQAGVNLVTVGVFSWSSLEPEPGRYEFGWLDRVLDLLAGNGIRVNLATPTASPPPWFSLAHPEALPVTADGVRLLHGSRDTYCVCSPAYREAAVGIARTLGERYGSHPALEMWHVHNEYGTTCYCDQVSVSFRRWLEDRYGGLAALNEAWTTAFWSQGYSAWEQVFPPRRTQYLANPAQVLDFRRFFSDELLTAYREQKAVLRSLSPGIPITTNFVFGSWVPVDHWRWAREVDLVAIDHYPEGAGIEAEQQTAFGADLARSWAGGGSWLLMEQAAGSLSDGGRMHAKEPGRMTRHSVSHIARGSRGSLFFQWRASRGGSERFHTAMVPHAGPDSRAFREITALGEALPRLAEADEGAVDAEVAILWDAESWWATDGPGLPSPEIDYLAAVRAAHRQLWSLGVSADFAHPTGDLSRYRAVIVPSLYLVSDEAAAAINRYAEGGGQLLVTSLSGIADATSQIRLGGYPGAFRDVLGLRVEEFLPVDSVDLDTGDRGTGWSERLRLEGAEALARYQGGPLDGLPAITRHHNAWYVSTWLDDPSYKSLVDKVIRAAGITPPALPEGVEVITRSSGKTRWRFILNHTSHPVALPGNGVDLLTGETFGDEFTVPAGAWAVLRD